MVTEENPGMCAHICLYIEVTGEGIFIHILGFALFCGGHSSIMCFISYKWIHLDCIMGQVHSNISIYLNLIMHKPFHLLCINL